MRLIFTPLASKITKKKPKKKGFGLPIATIYQKKPLIKRKKWVLFFILTLVILPSLPAQANVFEPIIKVLLPFYERIVGKDESAETQTDKPQTSTAPMDIGTPTEPTASPTPASPTSSPSPTPDLLTLLQAEFAADRDDPTTALKLYKAEALKDNATAVFERALGLSMQLESPAESLAFAKAWQDQNSDHVPVWFYVTHLALKAEDYPTAAQNIKLILAYDPNADLSQIFAGILPSSLSAQRALFTELQSIDNDQNPSLSVLKAGLLAQINEEIPAVLHLNNAIANDKNNLAYRIQKADILKDKFPEQLTPFLKQSIKTTQGETKKQLYLYHAHHLIGQGNLAGAWEVLKSSGKLINTDTEIIHLASLVALDIGLYDDANRLLSKLLDNPSTKNEAYYYLGISHERTQDYRIALAYFSKVNDMQFVLPAVKKQVAYELLFDNPDGAIASLVALRQNFEMYASDSYTLQAEILTRLGKTDEAKTLLDTAYEQYPDDPTLLYAKIQLMDNDADYDQKLAAIKSLLEFDPQNPAYRLTMARLLLHKMPNDKTALDIAHSVSQMSIESPDYNAEEQLGALLLLADHAYQQGDYQAVIDYLQTPYDVNPNLQVGTLLLRAYQKLGNTDQMQHLLADLQQRFGNDQNTQSNTPQPKTHDNEKNNPTISP